MTNQTYSCKNFGDEKIQVCGYRPCIPCFGSGNHNFPKGGQTTSRAPFPCKTCKGTGKETYFEWVNNPDYRPNSSSLRGGIWREETLQKNGGTTDDGEIRNEDKYLDDVLKTLISRNTMPPEMLSRYKDVIGVFSRIYESNPKIEKLNTEVRRLEQPKTTKGSNPPAVFTSPSLVSPNSVTLKVKPIRWHDWCIMESESGDMVDIMGRMSESFGRVMDEQEKIRWMKTFVSEYRQYAEHCRSQGVPPDPIPDVDILRRRLNYVTLSSGEKIHNPHYDPPGCTVM